jgi:hypothetical protein
MDEIENKFYKYILARTKEGKQEEVKKILKESYDKQLTGRFDNKYKEEAMEKIAGIIEPENILEVKSIIKNLDYIETYLRRK